MSKPAPASREAEIAARLERLRVTAAPAEGLNHLTVGPHSAAWAEFNKHSQDDCRYLLAELQQARQERDALIRDHNALLRDGARWQTRAEAAEAALQQAREALKAAEAKMFALGREFSSPRFTDRYGDGPELLRLAEMARAALTPERR